MPGVEDPDRRACEIGHVTRDQDQFVNDRRRGDDGIEQGVWVRDLDGSAVQSAISSSTGSARPLNVGNSDWVSSGEELRPGLDPGAPSAGRRPRSRARARPRQTSRRRPVRRPVKPSLFLRAFGLTSPSAAAVARPFRPPRAQLAAARRAVEDSSRTAGWFRTNGRV
jgi:hypothetical protein